MRARRVRARVLIARASITLYSIVLFTNVQLTASPCRPSLPTTTQHHAAPRKPSKHQPTDTHSTPQQPRGESVPGSALFRRKQTAKSPPAPHCTPTASRSRPGVSRKKVVKSSETCKKMNANLQKWTDTVYIIGHNVNDIRLKMQEPRQNERPPPILQDQDAPKIGERTKHFPL